MDTGDLVPLCGEKILPTRSMSKRGRTGQTHVVAALMVLCVDLQEEGFLPGP